ncbi:hypothetical protein ACEPPN_015680 [Leptodophora sp. 'Broadleaf-Isolate-01']
MIWKFTLEPRVVEMEFSENLGFYTVCKVPTALKVSQESQDTVKKSYVECFSSLWYHRGTLFNSAMDTLYLSRDFFDHVPAFFHTFHEKETAGIRYIAIDEDDFETGYNYESCAVPQRLEGLTALEEVTIVYDFKWSMFGRIESAGFQLQFDDAVKSKTMRFFNAPPPEFRRLGIRKSDKGWCESFHFLTNCKHRSVFGWRRNRVLLPYFSSENENSEEE